MTQRYGILLVLFTALLVTGLAQAMTLRKMDVESLALASDLILRGVVTGQQVQVDPLSGRPYTDTTIRPQATYKGEAGESVVIRQIGGTVDGITLWVSGTPRFEIGEELLVFLAPHRGRFVLRGMGQGAFQIRDVAGVPTAFQKLEDVSVVDPAQGEQARLEHPSPLELPLAELERRISLALSPASRTEGE